MATVKSKTTAKKQVEERSKRDSFSVPVYSLQGKQSSSMELPKEVFGTVVNKRLLAQALRVYLNNQKAHFAHTKTRGEVRGSTRKIYKQKGTGGARHGAKRAPIFVGGGIALGPKYRKLTLTMSQKMKGAALVSALSQKMVEKQIAVVGDLEKATGKTKEMARFVQVMEAKNMLFVFQGESDKLKRAVRNIPNVEWVRAANLNAYEVIKSERLVLTRDAVDALVRRINREGASLAEVNAGRVKNA